MAELLDRIHAEIRERMAESRAAAQEYDRLQAALAALGGPSEAPAPAAAPRRARRAAPQPRAPRGANREAVLRALEERPGASASELAAASGVNRTVLYGVLNRLIEQAEVAKEELPGGTTGYKRIREESSAFPARAAAEAPEDAPAPEAAAEAPGPDPDGPAPGDDAGDGPPHLAAAA
jgi:hypothetical protein